MDKLYITHYFYPGTDPWKNIMLLKESLGNYAYVEVQLWDKIQMYSQVTQIN